MESKALTIEEYDEPVWYCRSCHSLNIVVDESLAIDGWDGTYCGKCHSTDVGVCKMGEWLEEEERRKEKRRQIEWNR
jgi:Zn finger protein HypA/HybF involved in hydrogenase expression